MTLAETQALFHQLVTDGAPSGGALLDGCFTGTDELTAADRVAIYRNMYAARLVEALRDTFPNLARFLGEERFTALTQAYLAEHPSNHHDVGRIGRLLAAFLRKYPDPDRLDLADLAELEWARNEVFFAPDSRAAGVEALAEVGTQGAAGARLRMALSLKVIDLAHDAVALWRGLESGELLEPPRAGSAVGVWRRGFEVFHGALPAEEAAALRAAKEGATLEVVCGFFADRPDPAVDAHAAIASWFAEGWVSGLASAAP